MHRPSPRRLRRRYGHSRSHLPRSRLSLAEYEKRVNAFLADRREKKFRGEHERMEVLNGWRNGWQPETIGSSISLTRSKRK